MLNMGILNKLLVAAYKIAGFIVLTSILLGTATYIATQIFYFASHGWVTPVILATNDERVLRAQGQLAQQTSELERLSMERLEFEHQMAESQRRISLEKRFQQRFAEAMARDVRQRHATLQSLQHLLARYESLEPLLGRAGPEAAEGTAQHAQNLLEAHVIDATDYLERSAQVARMAQSHLALMETRLGLQDRLENLQTELNALQAPSPTAQTYGIVLMRREFERSKLEEQRAEATAKVLQLRRASLGDRLDRQQELVGALTNSPYLRAMARHATMAFVPYANLKHVTSGAPVYGCALGPLWCKRVGTVTQVVDGEVTGKHPLSNDEMRGVLLDLQLDDTWARRPVLHLRRTPLFT